MNTLRARIAFVLVISIVAVVGLASSAAIFVLGPRGPEKFVEPLVMQIQTLIPVFERLELNSGSPRSVAMPDSVTGFLSPNPRTAIWRSHRLSWRVAAGSRYRCPMSHPLAGHGSP